MLADIAARMRNDPDRERAIAAEEQRKITRLRLKTLIGARALMTRITSHVLDTSAGKPAAGLTVRLEQAGPGARRHGYWLRPPRDADGRVRDWLPGGVPSGRYRLVFETGAWFKAAGRDTLYPEVVVDFEVAGRSAALSPAAAPLAVRLLHLSGELSHDAATGLERIRQGGGSPGEGGSRRGAA